MNTLDIFEIHTYFVNKVIYYFILALIYDIDV